MNHSGNVILVRQAPGQSVNAGKRVGDRRRQYAKQIGKGYQPPCPQSLRSGQPDEHSESTPFSFKLRKHSGEASSRQAEICSFSIARDLSPRPHPNAGGQLFRLRHFPRNSGEPRPVNEPSSDSASAKHAPAGFIFLRPDVGR